MLGVIIGRFQVPSLHEAHKQLINYAVNNSNRLLILLGTSRAHEYRPTRRNPLSYDVRAGIVSSYTAQLFPGKVRLRQILDHQDDDIWSEEVDKAIEVYSEGEPVVIFGGRDSFIPHYHGKHSTFEVPGLPAEFSGNKIRQEIAELVSDELGHFARIGVIHSVMNRPLSVYPTVDIAVVSRELWIHDGIEHFDWYVLLGKKPNQNGWRLPGGFVDLTDCSYREAAGRELMEETDIGPEDGTYLECIDSFLIDDWRYPEGGDRIMTTLFRMRVEDGAIYENYGGPKPKAGDDLEQLRWVNLNDILNPSVAYLDIVKGHIPLINAVKESLGVKVYE